MPLTAIRAATNEIVESFDLSDEEWQRMKSEPPGAYLIRRTRRPAILKRNIQGTKWFAAQPGDVDRNWKPKSVEHEFAQVRMLKALRAAGFDARIEEPGKTPAGEEWEADVYFEDGDRKIAIEVQLSQQTFDEYVRRSGKYRQSGVRVCWLINSGHFLNFQGGCHAANGVNLRDPCSPRGAGREFHRDFPAFPISFRCPKGEPSDEAIQVGIYPNNKGWPMTDVSLGEFAVGVARKILIPTRHPQSGFRVWQWNAPAQAV